MLKFKMDNEFELVYVVNFIPPPPCALRFCYLLVHAHAMSHVLCSLSSLYSPLPPPPPPPPSLSLSPSSSLVQAVYQRIVQLSYIDKLLEQVSLAFRDRYKNEIVNGPFRMVNFTDEFNVSSVLV